MTRREELLIHMALIYAAANLDDLMIAFDQHEDDGPILVDGVIMGGVTEKELDSLIGESKRSLG